MTALTFFEKLVLFDVVIFIKKIIYDNMIDRKGKIYLLIITWFKYMVYKAMKII